MIHELFTTDLSIFSYLWQSSIFLVVGLIASYFLRRRPSRASQVLFLAMIGAIIMPTMRLWGIKTVKSLTFIS